MMNSYSSQSCRVCGHPAGRFLFERNGIAILGCAACGSWFASRDAHPPRYDEGYFECNGSPFDSLLGRRWHQLVPPFHLSFFSREGMKRILAAAGFRVEWLLRSGGWRNLGLLIPARYPVARRSLATAIPLPIGDMMSVVARRAEG